MATKYAIVKKISVKSVLGHKVKAPEDDKPVYVCQMVGVATGTKTGTSDKGDWTALLGSFQATNFETGEIVRSGVLFMPDVALNLVLPALNQKESKAVEFAFNIGVKKDENSTTGYIYVAEPVFETAENDPLEVISKKLPAAGKVAQLENKQKQKA